MVVRWIARVAGMSFAVAMLVAAGPAFAHLHVRADKAVGPGSTDVRLTVHVPNEKAGAHTIAVQVRLPAGLEDVKAERLPGWTEPGSTPPAAPTVVSWTGGSIGGGDGVDFVVRIGKLPTGLSELIFAVDQTYDDGEVVAWDEPQVEGAPEPEHPAPVLRLDETAVSGAAPPGAAPGGEATIAAVVSVSVGLLAWLLVRFLRRSARREGDGDPEGGVAGLGGVGKTARQSTGGDSWRGE